MSKPKYEMADGRYLPSAIAVLVGEISADPDKYKYVNAYKLIELAEDYARQVEICRNCKELVPINQYCVCREPRDV